MNKNRIRYKQRDFHLSDIDKLELDWSLEKYGCSPTSIANILVNYGYNINPIDVAKKILFDKNNNFDKTYLRNRGINDNGFVYCLDRLINEENLKINYEILRNKKKSMIFSYFLKR